MNSAMKTDSTTQNTYTVDKLINEYTNWLNHESSMRSFGEWREITLPIFDNSNDYLCFYAKDIENSITFTDDGFTLESLRMSGFTITSVREERIKSIARRFGVSIINGDITLKAECNRADAMNRYIQALIHIGGMIESVQRRVSDYFADDVASILGQCKVFYTQNISIRGISNYEHNFDFLFQRSESHPTRFCQAPNQFDKNTVKNIMWSWEDTRKTTERKDSKLIVIGDDRAAPLQTNALEAFINCGVKVIPYSELSTRAPNELAA